MAAILISVKGREINTETFDWTVEARREMKRQFYEALEDKEEKIEDGTANFSNETLTAYVENGKDNIDYNWKVEWV